MKTIRLLYPDAVSGGLATYAFGARLLEHLVPQNEHQPVIRVNMPTPNGSEQPVTHGIYAEEQVLAGIRDARKKLTAAQPDRVITLGGNCMVSLAPFDYLHGRYPNLGIVWLDAHPDVSIPENGYPNAHAMVLGSLLGNGAPQLCAEVKNPVFAGDEVLYVGLQPVHPYQAETLKKLGVRYQIQDGAFVSDEEIAAFAARFDHLLIHFDIDVLDARCFHSTYFANPALVGDGSGGGRMTLEKLGNILQLLSNRADLVGFTIAEYLPFDEERLHNLLNTLPLFTE